MKTKIVGMLLVTLLAAPMAANAALTDLGGSTLDTTTNLEWLDVTATAGMSYNAVLSSSYVSTQGYRFATEQEVSDLFAAAGGTNGLEFAASNYTPAQLLVSLLGCTTYLHPDGACDNSFEQNWGLAMWGSPNWIGIYAAFVSGPNMGKGSLVTRWGPAQVSDPAKPVRPDVGAFLVREARIAADLRGFYAPVDVPSVATNAAKAGQTIPLKFYAQTASGPISDLTTAYLGITSIDCEDTTTAFDAIEEYVADPNPVALVNLGGGHYQYNWKTSKNDTGCKLVTISLPGAYRTATNPIATFKFVKK